MRWIKKIRSFLITQQNPLIKNLIDDGLTYMWPSDLKEMSDAVIKVREAQIPGIFVEAGVALGGSAIFIGRLKEKNRQLHLYDVFDMIPEPSAQDEEDVHTRYQQIKSGQSQGIKGNTYYGYEKDLLSKVQSNFREYDLEPNENNISFIKGKFQDTMRIQEAVAFAHLDCDWYESVKYCLDQIHPKLVKGGRFLIDDYFHYSGCRKAVDEFLLKYPDAYKRIEKSKLHLIKT